MIPENLSGPLGIVTEAGMIGVLIWIARELGAIRAAVTAQVCRFKD